MSVANLVTFFRDAVGATPGDSDEGVQDAVRELMKGELGWPRAEAEGVDVGGEKGLVRSEELQRELAAALRGRQLENTTVGEVEAAVATSLGARGAGAAGWSSDDAA